LHVKEKQQKLEMWTGAQHDGCPAVYVALSVKETTAAKYNVHICYTGRP